MSRLLRVSRPRFWMYVFGPYIVGALCGASAPKQFFSPLALVFALFFIFPANLLIYGVNDIFDYETDVLNAKKRGYETLIPPDERWKIGRATFLFCAPFLAFLPFVPRESFFALIGFLFFSLFYSAPPIRAKARPILDSAFNVLYIFPGVFAYFLCGGKNFSWILFLGAWSWAMAMHAYSAVPDISADKEANVPTVATFLGLRGTLWLCLALYSIAAICAEATLGFAAISLWIVYATLMFRSLKAKTESGVMKIYQIFPLINTLAGAAIFWFVLWTKTAFWPRF
ncbi:4-hydroxybenzoate polyprenyltransferase [Abditibacterium utsteinense]|uniref:4-hydroxybenzoate polyprenyltransferase n=1 Tax=Abditibacterium utsteinense TaxID=1960156 RepID=A0A2S8SX68_9BACT|nr:prenyltransferase [Abditibacterium utsteinense]PQV65400.1 4-hydroxybenzoate polyprenyltransferase [Abditibacterium utsteinense]